MAVGIALRKEHLPDFRQRFAEAVCAHAGSDIAESRLNLATWLAPEEIGPTLMDELDRLHPFGQGNPEPTFGVRGVVLRSKPEIFKAVHFRFQIDDNCGRKLHGVAWKMANRIPPVGVRLDLAVELKWNHFNDRKFLQLSLIDWRRSET